MLSSFAHRPLRLMPSRTWSCARCSAHNSGECGRETICVHRQGERRVNEKNNDPITEPACSGVAPGANNRPRFMAQYNGRRSDVKTWRGSIRRARYVRACDSDEGRMRSRTTMLTDDSVRKVHT